MLYQEVFTWSANSQCKIGIWKKFAKQTSTEFFQILLPKNVSNFEWNFQIRPQRRLKIITIYFSSELRALWAKRTNLYLIFFQPDHYLYTFDNKAFQNLEPHNCLYHNAHQLVLSKIWRLKKLHNRAKEEEEGGPLLLRVHGALKNSQTIDDSSR